MRTLLMRPRLVRSLVWLVRILGGAVVLAALLLAVLVVGLQTRPGLDLLARGIEAGLGAAGFPAKVERLEGPFPARLALSRLELSDPAGPFLTIETLELAWSPSRLFDRSASITHLTAGLVRLDRLPASGPETQDDPASDEPPAPLRLPVDIALDRLAIARLELGEALPGGPASFSVEGSARLDRGALSFLGGGEGGNGAARLSLTRLDPGREGDRIGATLGLDGARIDLRASLDEAPGGTLPRLAQLPARPASLRLDLDGPLDAGALHAVIGFGEGLAADLSGTVDLRRLHGSLRLTAGAEAAALSPLLPEGLTWRALALTAQVEGDLTRPALDASLQLDAPALAANGADQLRLDATLRPAEAGSFALSLTGSVTAARAEALPPELSTMLAEAPLTLDAAARLRPSGTLALDRLVLRHPLTTLRLSGDAAASTLGLDLLVESLQLAPLSPGLQGEVSANLRIEGPPAAPRITGLLGSDRIERDGFVSGPVTLHLDATPLGDRPKVWARLAGILVGNAADLTLEAERNDQGFLLSIPDGRIAGATLSADAAIGVGAPRGSVKLDAPDLAPFGRLAGQALSGRARVEATLAPCEDTLACATATALLTGFQGPGVSVRSARLEATGRDVTGALSGKADLRLEGLVASSVAADATLTAEGSLPQGIDLTLAATGPELAANLRGRLALPPDADARFDLAAFRLAWRQERVELTAPARLAYGPSGASVDRLRLGLRDGRVEIAGRAGDTLALQVTARGLPLALAELAGVTGLQGRLDLDANLTGTQAAPRGDARLALRQVRTEAASWLPAATLDATARLAGGPAILSVTASAGPGLRLSVNGTAGTTGELPLALRVDGSVEGRTLDPLLLPAGRRLSGTVRLRGQVGGTASAPQPDLRLVLEGGSLRSAIAGVSLTAIGLSVRLLGDQVTIERARAQVGPGSIELSGTARPLADPPQAALRFVARNAEFAIEPYATMRLSADLALQDQFAPEGRRLAASGSIALDRAEIRVPDRLPPTIVDLPVREIGGGRVPVALQAAPVVAPSSLPPIALDITITAPRAVFVRGRGIESEFGGQFRIGGTATDPSVQGGLDLRRGSIDILANRIDLTRGAVRFTGGLTPELDILATSDTGDVQATVNVQGRPDDLKFILASSPTLPQDEILARILFGKASAGLSPLELLELSRAIAQLTGVGGQAAGFDPVGRLRTGLGLDRLSVTSGPGDTGPQVEAGRYIADGVYVGAVQGAEAGSARARVEIEVAPGFSVRAESGSSDSGGTRAGVVYRFEY